MIHDFQRDVSHLERLAELWLRATRRRDERVGVDLPIDEESPKTHSGKQFVKTFAMQRPSKNVKNVVNGTSHDRGDLVVCCNNNCKNTAIKF